MGILVLRDRRTEQKKPNWSGLTTEKRVQLHIDFPVRVREASGVRVTRRKKMVVTVEELRASVISCQGDS